MAQCFRDQLTAATTDRKRARLWFRTIADLTLTVPVRHLECMARLAHGGAFHLYSAPAKRAIFFARYETASFNDPQITLEHLLLGILREDRELAVAILGHAGIDKIVQAIESMQANPRHRPILQSHPVPISPECRIALESACRQAHISGAKVTPRRLIAAILNSDSSEASRLLRKNALDLSRLSQAD